jgi:ribonuclease P/MRP protein subunit POP1
MQAHRWGHVLAEGAPGRGRGSRAALAALRGGALLHDASYWRPVQLAGPLAALRSALALLWCGPPHFYS